MDDQPGAAVTKPEPFRIVTATDFKAGLPAPHAGQVIYVHDTNQTYIYTDGWKLVTTDDENTVRGPLGDLVRYMAHRGYDEQRTPGRRVYSFKEHRVVIHRQTSGSWDITGHFLGEEAQYRGMPEIRVLVEQQTGGFCEVCRRDYLHPESLATHREWSHPEIC